MNSELFEGLQVLFALESWLLLSIDRINLLDINNRLKEPLVVLPDVLDWELTEERVASLLRVVEDFLSSIDLHSHGDSSLRDHEAEDTEDRKEADTDEEGSPLHFDLELKLEGEADLSDPH